MPGKEQQSIQPADLFCASAGSWRPLDKAQMQHIQTACIDIERPYHLLTLRRSDKDRSGEQSRAEDTADTHLALGAIRQIPVENAHNQRDTGIQFLYVQCD